MNQQQRAGLICCRCEPQKNPVELGIKGGCKLVSSDMIGMNQNDECQSYFIFIDLILGHLHPFHPSSLTCQPLTITTHTIRIRIHQS
jgi:hypothetical protein